MYQNIFFHLIQNAIKFSHNGRQITVTVAFKSVAKQEDRVVFQSQFVKEQDWGNLTGKLITRITDTGIGMDESHFSKR